MFVYQKFYLSHGIQRLTQLTKPPMDRVNNLLLPLNSTYHCTEFDPEDIGVMPDDEILSHIKSEVVVDHVTELDKIATLGNPIKLSLQANSLIQEYHQKNKMFRRATGNTSLLKNPRTLYVVSYNLISRHYRYIEHFTTPYNQWANMMLTVLSTINRMSNNGDRQHFIQLHLPIDIPTLSELQLSEKDLNQTVCKRFNTDSLRLIADLYTWIGINRDKSLLSKLDKKVLNRVNILFIHNGQWTVLNLGKVDDWRLEPLSKEQLDALDANAKKARSGKTPADVLSKRYIRFLIGINEATTSVDDIQTSDDVVDDDEYNKDDDQDNADSEASQQQNDSLDKMVKDKLSKEKEQKSGSLTDAIQNAEANNRLSKDEDDYVGEVEDKEITDSDIDKDLQALELLAKQKEEDALLAGTYKPYVSVELKLEDSVKQKAEKLARQGKLSAAEFRALSQMATRYKSIKNPFNAEQTLEQLATIDPKSLEIPEKVALVDKLDGVVDSSMLQSSLKNFDSKYIREILQKDIAAAVLNFQKAGIIIRNYSIRHVEDLTDSYYELVIDAVPLVGTPQLLRVKFPKINENGQFRASGVTNRMRKQRGDLPIRKTAPDTVALTSYYSKMFVTRSERSNFNYEKWLGNRITAEALTTGSSITNVKMADVFQSEVKLPRIYTIIARKISAFSCKGYEFFFDWKNRIDFFTPEVISVTDKLKDDKKLLTPVAKGLSTILLLSARGELLEASLTEKKELDNLGSFEEFIGLDINAKPDDVAEVGIFGKLIPLGFILGFKLGLGNLLATIGANFRRVAKGNNYNLTGKEFTLKFEDETLVIERNGISELILAGFNRFAKDIKRYSVYNFDRQEVYSNILETNGIGVRWSREFGHMFDLWVDHITRDILIQMGEPTDLVLLFIRAAELLLTDQSPHQMDITYMRDKGYERIAGMVYFEMVKATRGYISKPATAKAAIELNPQAVWMGLLQDQSVMPVDESNPIHSLKEQEEIIYSGAGGRTARSMTESARIFHRSSMGVVSEATKDSGDVATVVYTTADPNYTSMRGMTRRLDKKEGNASRLLSTSALLAAASQHDDQLYINKDYPLYYGLI